MPRGPRLDAPGVLHHVMARGIEQTLLFRTEEDRRDFLRRLGAQVETSGAHVLAWALLQNHVHLLVRTDHRPVASLMRRLLTGYAAAFNRRHRRHGHLFQNCYRSIVVGRDVAGLSRLFPSWREDFESRGERAVEKSLGRGAREKAGLSVGEQPVVPPVEGRLLQLASVARIHVRQDVARVSRFVEDRDQVVCLPLRPRKGALYHIV